MPASIANDKLRGVRNGGYPQPTTVSTTRSPAGTSLSCVALTNWFTDTPVDFITYKKKTDGSIDQSTKTGWKGIVSGNTITSLTLVFGTDAGNANGDFVEMAPTDEWAQGVYDFGMKIHNADGSLKSKIITGDKIDDGAVTTAKINDEAVTTGKIDFTTFVRPVVMTYTMPSSSNASLSITGVGFKPRMVMTNWRGGSASSATGFAGSASVAIGGSGITQSISAWNAASGTSYTSGNTTAFVGMSAAGGSAFDWSASLTSFDSDGITMNYTYSSGTVTSRAVTFIFF